MVFLNSGMPQRTLRFRIRQDGLVEESVEGVLGNSCAKLTENLEEALGQLDHREATSESFLHQIDQTQNISAEQQLN